MLHAWPARLKLRLSDKNNGSVQEMNFVQPSLTGLH
jgi:hypothetical protein